MKQLITLLISIVLPLSYVEASIGEPWFISDLQKNGGNVIISSFGTNSIKEIASDGAIVQSWSLPSSPTGLVVYGNKAYVTCFDDNSSLVVVDLEQSDKIEEFVLNSHSGVTSPVISNDGSKIYICNKFNDAITEYDVASNEVTRTVKVLREPADIILSKDQKHLFVLNFLPAQRADVDHVGCEVSVIDVETFKKIKDIKLENGSNALRGAALSPDGKYLFISHNLGRYTVPTSQLQQGWMNTSALSIVNTGSLIFEGSVLVDEAERGAAGTWGVACDDKNLYVSHSGVHEISVINYADFLKKYEAYKDKTTLNYDLHFLYGIRNRVKLEGNGPRNFIVSDGVIIAPMYFSDHINFYNVDTEELKSVALNPERIETPAQIGEKMFNDASYCFQNWQSCNGCHPGDGRTDGLNWDLMNDGVGNSKNCKSLLLSIATPPSMISGIRASGYVANRAGFKFIQFHEISEEQAKFIDEYIMSLKPVASPALVNGELSEKATLGRKVFEKYKCDNCHSGAYYTDYKMHRIGDNIEFENGWDTPTLIEVWRTAPYLFDGRAYTLHDVFDVEKHGINKKISNKELNALVEYVKSL